VNAPPLRDDPMRRFREASAPPPLTLLGRSVHGVISWNINDTCNYRCSYCTQRFMPWRGKILKGDAEVDHYLSAFAGLPGGTWEVKLSGGEPFAQPGLEAIAGGLVRLGHLVSIQTNFSAPERRIRAFLEATEGALHVFSASLHLEYATVDAFLERYRWVEPWVRTHGVRFNVTSVATPARLAQLRDEIAPRFRDAGISFKVQPEKQRGYVRDYSPDELAMLTELGGHNRLGEIAHDFQGRLCWAGARYVVIKSTGEAYRCYAASRVGGVFARCGSVAEGLRLEERPRPCPYTYCNCSVPIERGMIEGVPRRAEAAGVDAEGEP
jgi:organic radical activating enzyme